MNSLSDRHGWPIASPLAGQMQWRIAPHGIVSDHRPNEVMRTPGEPMTMRRILAAWGELIAIQAKQKSVPWELIAATIASESAGSVGEHMDRAAIARREEPGFVSDDQTPDKVSMGLMQTLLSTARAMTRIPELTSADLEDPHVSIAAGTAYIADCARRGAGFDPILIAASYNAGALYDDLADANPWKLRCFPIGTGAHITRFAEWFGDALAAGDESIGRGCIAAAPTIRGFL